ncbi:MAG: hypothetical protein NTZ49_04955 [Candidatus Parcubacteria bacterium]|nr:hypothetical protein [Candidatus Parcubacteria bacterium]
MFDLNQLTDAELEQLTSEQTAQMDDVQITQLSGRLAKLSHELKATKAHYKLWGSLRETEAVIAEIRASETLSEREDWLKWYCYNNRHNHLPELTHEEFAEVFMLLKQPFSLIRERLSELMSIRYWPLGRSLVLYDISQMTFPVSREDGQLVSEIMRGQQEHYDTTIKPYLGMPSQWDDDEWPDDYVDERTRWEKMVGWFSWKYQILSAPFRKPWPPRGIEHQLSGSIYEQSPDAFLQLRFKWGHWSNRIGTNPDLDFVPVKPLEHFRFGTNGINGKADCYNLYHPCTGDYPWCHLIPVLENPTGNDADWRFKDGCVFEYCLKDESNDSHEFSVRPRMVARVR